MCGLNGILAYHASAVAPERRELIATRDYMRRRGPDDAGEWWCADRRIGLGHRRLSIMDLSDRGSQPMVSSCGRYVVVFNGEIYNYPDLRCKLEEGGVSFRSESDTEVLLHLFARHGAKTVELLRGMFAFAVWDDSEKRLFLARDHYGIKPLYYSDDGKTFRFASQVKALLSGGAAGFEPDPGGTIGFYLWGNIPEPFTIYRDIRALPAGHFLWVEEGGAADPTRYFSLAEELKRSALQTIAPDKIDHIVAEAARESVAAHLLADVEVGLFLSAGIDSTSLLGLMRDAGAQKIRAITLAFGEYRGTEEDESLIARQMAQHYGAEHIVRTVDENEFLNDLPQLLESMDQPTIDGINTYFVSKAAHEVGLKVALSGTGGDELLAGYPSFADIPDWVSKMRLIDRVPGIGRLVRMLMVASGATARNPKLAGIAEYGGSFAGAYMLKRGLFMPWELDDLLDDRDFVAQGLRALSPLSALKETLDPDPGNPNLRVAALEGSWYLKNQLLRDADWASMAHSLEVRTPFVDVDFMRSASKVTGLLKGRRGKEALSRSPSRPLPEDVRDRAKTGFHVPIGSWLSRAVGSESGNSTKGSASRVWAQQVLARYYGSANFEELALAISKEIA